MGKMFLDPKKPLSTCESLSCEECSVSQKLNCHFNIQQLIRFISIVLPPAIVAGFTIIAYNPVYIILWLAMFLVFFGFVEIRVMCSHCPHYAEPDLKSLKCWANYGSLKLWKYRPGPMSIKEKIIFFTGAIFIFTFPLPFFIAKFRIINLILLGLYLFLIFVALFLLRKYYCSHCINFACPLNSVDKEIHIRFINKNPVIKDAWETRRTKTNRD